MLKQFENGNDVRSIYDLIMDKPAGGSLSVIMANWIRVEDGRIVEQKIYYWFKRFLFAERYIGDGDSADNNLVTVINVFTVESHNQEKLVTLLERATDSTTQSRSIS